MKTSNALVLILVLLYIDASTEWPTHTVCKEDNLEIYYKSCGEIFKNFRFPFSWATKLFLCSERLINQAVNGRVTIQSQHWVSQLKCF